MVVVWAFPNTQQILGRYAHRNQTEAENQGEMLWHWKPTMLWAASFSAVFLLCLLLMQNPSRFLYFQF
jgi:hypothetical protein